MYKKYYADGKVQAVKPRLDLMPFVFPNPHSFMMAPGMQKLLVDVYARTSPDVLLDFRGASKMELKEMVEIADRMYTRTVFSFEYSGEAVDALMRRGAIFDDADFCRFMTERHIWERMDESDEPTCFSFVVKFLALVDGGGLRESAMRKVFSAYTEEATLIRGSAYRCVAVQMTVPSVCGDTIASYL